MQHDKFLVFLRVAIAGLALSWMTWGATPATAAACIRQTISNGGEPIPATGRLNDAALNAAFLVEVNYQRCRAGLRPLATDNQILSAAKKHAQWMSRARKMSHQSTAPGQRTIADRLRRSGVSFRIGAENIAQVPLFQFQSRMFMTRDAQACVFTIDGQRVPPHTYQSLARYVVDMWMNSPGHRKNILNTRVRRTAATASLNSGTDYCGDMYIAQAFAG